VQNTKWTPPVQVSADADDDTPTASIASKPNKNNLKRDINNHLHPSRLAEKLVVQAKARDIPTGMSRYLATPSQTSNSEVLTEPFCTIRQYPGPVKQVHDPSQGQATSYTKPTFKTSTY